MSAYSPDLPKKNAIVPVHESGRDYPEGEPKPDPIKYYKVLCPYCRALPNQPCKFSKGVDYRIIHISRLILFEAFELGTVDVNGIGRNGRMIGGKE